MVSANFLVRHRKTFPRKPVGCFLEDYFWLGHKNPAPGVNIEIQRQIHYMNYTSGLLCFFSFHD